MRIDLDRMTNDPGDDRYAYRPRGRSGALRRLLIVSAIAILVLCLAALCSGPARADFLLSTPEGALIFRDNFGSAEPHVIHVPRDLSVEAQERERAWEQACVIGFHADDLGAEHYVYRRVGCEYGRINGRLK